MTRTQKGQDTDLLREALGETRELTLVLMQESDSDSDGPPPLVSGSSDEDGRPAAQVGAEEILETSSDSTESSDGNRMAYPDLALVRAALAAAQANTEHPREIVFLEGTRVTVRFASGRVVLQRLVHAQTEQEIYMMGMLEYLVGFFRLPEQCLQVAWQMKEPFYCEATLVPLPASEYRGLDYGQDCCICCGADDDNGEVLTVRSRAMNCVRCGPDVVCTQCRFRLPGRVVCMYCLRENELSLVSPRQQFRWRCLVGPEPEKT